MKEANGSQKPLRKAAKNWIRALPPKRIFHVCDLYQFLEINFPELCTARGDALFEPQYQNDARWAVRDTKVEAAIEPTGRKGEYRRIQNSGIR